MDDLEFSERQAVKIDDFCTTKLRELPPEEFMEMLYSAVEQDAWLLYAHGGLLGLVVGVVLTAICTVAQCPGRSGHNDARCPVIADIPSDERYSA